MSRRDKRQEVLNKAETQLVTVYACTIRYQASSSNYRGVSASPFEMRSLTVDDNTLCQMAYAAWTSPHFIRLRDTGGSKEGWISYHGLAGCLHLLVKLLFYWTLDGEKVGGCGGGCQRNPGCGMLTDSTGHENDLYQTAVWLSFGSRFLSCFLSPRMSERYTQIGIKGAVYVVVLLITVWEMTAPTEATTGESIAAKHTSTST